MPRRLIELSSFKTFNELLFREIYLNLSRKGVYPVIKIKYYVHGIKQWEVVSYTKDMIELIGKNNITNLWSD